MKLGKLAPVVDYRVPHLSRRMMAVKPKPAVDWTKAVDSWGALANDQIGDCTAAAAYHLIQAWRANNFSKWQPTDADAIALYSATSGYPQTDEGAVESEVLKYWSTTGVPGDGITDTIAFCRLFEKNLDELRLSIEYFGGVYLGVALPLSAQGQAVWDVAPPGTPADQTAAGSWGGHAICAVAYDETSFTVVTWGALMKVTPAFMAAYLDEAYAVVSKEWLDVAGITPPGLSWPQLQADMASLKD